ncbi:cell wall protein [Ophiocordyceps camponoti-floridani]|uniref:Cell wall protein n=1 Tax=Ophiocordyceps camponoti-floridani TaxID=2030778 RepID=A0A8H4Q0X2_9HYPO|nr:cell wall protein [Ophiocordyceps camponoti-floridani]
MKSALLVTLAASLAAAQDLGGMPACAKDCVSKYMGGSSVAGCQAADIACVCKNKDFLNNIACCLSKACKPEDQDKTISFAKQLCNAAGVQVPDKVECNKEAATSASASSSSSSSSSSATSLSASPSATRAASSASAPMMPAPGLLLGSLLAMLPAAI